MSRARGTGIRHLLTLTTAAALLLVAGCKKKEKEVLYFPDLKAPLGAGTVKTVADQNKNPVKGTTSITVRAVVQPDIDRDELDRLAKSFMRQAADRRGFRKGGAEVIDIRFYTSEAAAKKAGDDWLARAWREAPGKEPRFENRQKLPLVKWARKALGKQPEFSGALKPQILANHDEVSIEVIVPFVALDGTGQYVKKLSYQRATADFTSYVSRLFDKVPALKKVTFVGKHDDKEVMRIWLTREQYDQLGLRQLEESLGAYQGKFIEPQMSGRISEKQVARKVAKERRRLYREALGRLPPEQVQLARWLR